MNAVDKEVTLATGAQAGFAQIIGAWVAGLNYADLSPEVLHWARVGIIDTFGVTFAGAREDAPRLAARALGDNAGPCLVLGTQRRTTALDAALINGTASHALDFDDCNNTMGGHPSVPLLAALLPLAEELNSSGADLVTAYVAGFEVETKIAMAVNFHHYTKGWHPTSTLGTFGAAAAAARLMGLDAAATAVALAIAASFASGIKANFGTMTKPLHIGHCARNGLYAARLASLGFTANPESVFEHKQGFLDVFNGPGTYDVARALAAWAAPYDIVTPGIAIKQYPCCGSTHPAVDSALAIYREHQPRGEDIERIELRTHSRRLQHTNRPAPNSSLDAKFSVQYVVTRALLSGHVGVSDFEDGTYDEPAVRALLTRVHAAAYNETGDGGFSADNHFGGLVRVTLKDGTVLAAQVDQPLGRTSANALPEALLHRKFELCALKVLQPDAIAAITEDISHIDSLPSIRALTARIAAATLAS